MRELPDLLRNLLYALRQHRQPSSLIVFLIAGLTTAFGSSLFDHVEHLVWKLISFIGSVVVVRFMWHHGNDALEEINEHDRKIQQEARRTRRLLAEMLGFGDPPNDPPDSKNHPHEPNSSAE